MKPMPTWFRGVSYAMAALLVVCVVLQYNDPDPLRWMLIYGGGALLSAVVPTRPRLGEVTALYGLVTAGWAIYLVAAIWGQMGVSDLWLKMSEKGGAVEVGREAGGLGIQAAWLVFAGYYARARR